MLGNGAEIADRRGVIARTALTDGAAGESGLPEHRLLDFGESSWIASSGRGRHPDGLLARQVSCSLQGIDPHIHQGTAAGQLALQAPDVGFRVIAEIGVDHLQSTELLAARDAHAFQVMRLELAAIGDAQHAVRGAHGSDHLLTALDGNLQRLLAEDVFARFGRGHGMVQV